MKNILLSSLIIIPSALLSYELEFNKSFKKDILNDRISSNIEIKVNAKDIDFINEKIEFFQDFINEESVITKNNGNFSLLPKYNYENNKQHFVGYSGTLNYNIQSNKYENINQFINKLNDIRKNMNTNQVILSTSNIHWIVSDDSYSRNIDLMRIDTIDWIKKYISTLNNKCELKNISINEIKGGTDVLIAAQGSILEEAVIAYELLKEKGISCAIWSVPWLKPLDKSLIEQASAKFKLIMTLEEAQIYGGLGSAFAEIISTSIASKSKLIIKGVPDSIVHQSISQLNGRFKFQLDGNSLAAEIWDILQK